MDTRDKVDRRKTRCYTADFETIQREGVKSQVWSFGVVELADLNAYYCGTSLDEFMEFIIKNPWKRLKFYFHNLKYDGTFIVDWLLKNGYTYVNKKPKEVQINEFSTLIDDNGKWYRIHIREENHIVDIFDSLKLLPMKLSKIAETFNFVETKGKIDYLKVREEGYVPTQEEREYQKNDCIILARALNEFFAEASKELTIGGCALADFKETLKRPNEIDRFGDPQLFTELFKNKITREQDYQLRLGYKGGFNWLNPEYKKIRIYKKVKVLDRNSMYPSILYNEQMPYGKPIEYDDIRTLEELRSIPKKLFLVFFHCDFQLKPDKLPTVVIKRTRYSKNCEVREGSFYGDQLVMTNAELDLFLEHYYVDNFCVDKVYAFKSKNTFFKAYIDKWYKKKEEATLEHNTGRRLIAKLFLNNLGGKFGTVLGQVSRGVKIEKGIVSLYDNEATLNEGVYLPVSVFLNAYGRVKLLEVAQGIYEQKVDGKHALIYCDTDSVHFIDEIDTNFIDIDQSRLGAWKVEEVSEQSLYLKLKVYLHYTAADGYVCKCAGMPEEVKLQVNFDNFKEGEKIGTQLVYSIVEGGATLVERDFTIR